MWLPWRGIPNQIRIEAEPRMEHMITEYNRTNEILYGTVEPGVYRITNNGMQIEEIMMLNIRKKCVNNRTALFIESDRNSSDEENNAIDKFGHAIR